jgi:hypothetical protein
MNEIKFWVSFFDIDGIIVVVKEISIDLTEFDKRDILKDIFKEDYASLAVDSWADRQLQEYDAFCYSCIKQTERESQLVEIIVNDLTKIGYKTGFSDLSEIVIEWLVGFVCNPTSYISDRYEMNMPDVSKMLNDLKKFDEWRDK